MPRDHRKRLDVVLGDGFEPGVWIRDDCEGTLGWVKAGTGGDDSLSYATAASLFGTKGLELVTRTTAAATDDFIRADKDIHLPTGKRLVMRARVSSPDFSKLKDIRMLMQLDNGTDEHRAGMRYVVSSGKLEYQTGLTTWTDTGFANPGTRNLLFWEWELIVDPVNMKYVSLSSWGLDLDLAGVAIPGDLDMGTMKHCKCRFYVTASGANAVTMYADSIYVGKFLAR